VFQGTTEDIFQQRQSSGCFTVFMVDGVTFVSLVMLHWTLPGEFSLKYSNLTNPFFTSHCFPDSLINKCVYIKDIHVSSPSVVVTFHQGCSSHTYCLAHNTAHYTTCFGHLRLWKLSPVSNSASAYRKYVSTTLTVDDFMSTLMIGLVLCHVSTEMKSDYTVGRILYICAMPHCYSTPQASFNGVLMYNTLIRGV